MIHDKTKILFDHQAFDMQDYGGISRYFSNLISGIQSSELYSSRLPLLYSSNYYIRNAPQLSNNILGRHLLRKRSKRIKWNKALDKLYLSNGQYDVFHATYFDPYFLDFVKKPFVITVHDMIYENGLQISSETETVIHNKRTLIESANLIIAISNFTKAQILKHFPNIDKKIHVVHHGIPENIIQAANKTLPAKYILYVGDRLASYKNFNAFLSGVSRLLVEDTSLYLICAGGHKFTDEENRLLQYLGISHKVNQYNVTESQLVQLYENAYVFMYPSLEEGFGLPILEAFKYNCAVACSKSSCFPEVAGDAAAYFDPLDEESIYQATLGLITNQDLRNSYIKKGSEQLKSFKFEKSLLETLACYDVLKH